MKKVFSNCLACLFVFAAPTFAETYELQPGDRIHLSVIGVSDLEHLATVHADGSVRLPLVGRLEVAGTNIDELTDTLTTVFAEREGIRPDAVLLEIVDYRPVFVVGASRESSALPYRPGMTVLQAAIQATDAVDNRDLRLLEKLEAGRTTGAAEQATEQLAAALLNRARLLAERDDTDLVLPERPKALDDMRWQLLTKSTQATLDQQRGSYQKLLDRLDALETVLRQRVDALANERDLQEQAILVLQEELDSLTRSEMRGLVTQDRLNSARVRLLDAQLNRLRLLSDGTAAQSDVTLIIQERNQSRQQRDLEIAAELEQLETQIGSLTLSLTQARRDLSLVRAETGRSASEESDILAASFFIHRKQGTTDALEVRAAGPGDFLKPGDILEVRY